MEELEKHNTAAATSFRSLAAVNSSLTESLHKSVVQQIEEERKKGQKNLSKTERGGPGKNLFETNR